ncbi:MAG TPA: hypothetical protein EYG83_08925, partial [Sulfurospirillum arcachonense]|nr:hypothetical protein [Sulfurospirillum arcachonense]
MIERLFENAPWKRTLFFIVADFLLFYLAFYTAYLLRFNLHIPPEHILSSSKLIFPMIMIKIVLFYLFHIYFITWRYFVLSDTKKILYALVVSYFIFVAYVILVHEGAFPRTVIMIDFLLSFLFVVGLRLAKRMFNTISRELDYHPTIIIGANQKALSIVGNARSGEIGYDPLAIIDDQKSVINSYIANIKVHPMSKMESLIKKDKINSAIITKEYPPKE